MPVLTQGRLRIPIVQADVPLVRGERTLMWTFGGTFPGPDDPAARGRDDARDVRAPHPGGRTR